MRRLLTHLAQFSAFSKQGEVLCTRGLEFLLEHKEARNVFACQMLNEDTYDDLHWRAEVPQQDNARPDLEGYNKDGKPVVKVEAKLGAPLHNDQIHSYVNDLVERSGFGLLFLLVPQYRLDEVKSIVENAIIPKTVNTIISSWEDVIDCLRNVSSTSFLNDLKQFDAMYRVLSGDDIEPLADIDAIRLWRDREDVFIHYVDRATRKLSVATKLYPLDLDSRMNDEHHMDPSHNFRVPIGGYLRRYVICIENGPKSTSFSLGVRDPFKSYYTPIWHRFHNKTPGFSEVRERLRRSQEAFKIVTSSGHIWIPIDIPLGAEANSVVQSIVQDTEHICKVVRGEI